MREDSDRLLATVETVLKAGELGQRQRVQQRTRVELHPLVADCISTVLLRHHLQPEDITLEDISGSVRLFVLANIEDLRTAILNLIDNAVKYSPEGIHITCSIGIERYTWAVLSDSSSSAPSPSSTAAASAPSAKV
jgi:two-component system sensor histidine kinase SenX3